MTLQSISHQELQQILKQIEQANHDHRQWYSMLIRSLVCHLPLRQNAPINDAYRYCKFGLWYYNESNTKLREHPSFIAIGKAHRLMHDQVNKLLTCVNKKEIIPSDDYDLFADTIEQLQLEVHNLQNELRYLLYYRDPLTMAISRGSMLPLLHELQAQSQRQKLPYCLAMIDLDYFKNINDQYGHLVGDRVLRTVAHRMLESLRPYDKLFRFGGDEFLVCIQQIGLTGAMAITERLRKKVQAPIDIAHHKPISISVSIGLTLLDPEAPVDASIKHADEAMYTAKATGRNRIKIWNDMTK